MIPSALLRRLLFVIPLGFLAVFYFYPLSRIVLFSFLPDGIGGTWDPEKLSRLFHSPVYLNIIWFTIWQAALSTIITLTLALPGAYVFVHYRFPGKNILQGLMSVPFVLPTVVTAAAFRALLGTNGVLNTWLMNLFDLTQAPIQLDQTIYFFLIAHVFYNYTLVLRIVSSYWAGLSPDIQTAATMLGASPWQSFRKITLPLLLPAIGSAALLVFIFCFTSFGVILILGGPGYATIEVEIYRQSVQLFNLPMAAALSLIQLGINFLLMWIHAGLSRTSNVSFFGNPANIRDTVLARRGPRIMVSANVIFMSLLLMTPLAALLLRSISGSNGITLAYYTALFSRGSDSIFFIEPITAVGNSLGFALCAMTVALVLGVAASSFLAAARKDGKHKKAKRYSQYSLYSRYSLYSFWDAIIMLPLATSAVTLGFGYIITLNTPPLNLRDSIFLVIIAHALVAFPFVVRCILPSLRQIPDSLRHAAAVLGASPFQVWRSIDMPLISRALLVGAIFAFLISMGEFGASAFIVRPHTPTMPVAIFRFLGQPGDLNYGQAMAMSSLLMLVSCCSFWGLEKLGRSHLR
ncbi:MAG: ABC transporter permease [Desulfopila sp.]